MTTAEAIKNLTEAVSGAEQPQVSKTVDALRNLFVALGGPAEDVANVSTIPEMINKLAIQTEDANYLEMFSGIIDRSIKKAVIPDSVDSIGSYAFQDCILLTSVQIPESVAEIKEGAFYNCSELVDAAIPGLVDEIGSSAFKGCTKLKTTIPQTVKTFGNNSFYGCAGIEGDLTITNGANVGGSAFQNCTSIESVVIGENSTVGGNAFQSCTGLKSAVLRSGCTPAANAYRMFSGCTSLERAVLEEGCTQTVGYMFADCTSLREVYLPSTMGQPGINPSPFTGNNSGADLHIYCAFGQNDATGAPWGATNATIVYNYTPSE